MKTAARHSGSLLPLCFLLAAFLAVDGQPIAPAYAAETQTYAVSFPPLQSSSGEAIAFFQIQVTAGAFVDISNLPAGWYLDIDNSPSWQTKIKGQTIVGAASLTPGGLRKLNFQIQKREIGDLKFNLTGDVSFTKDYEKMRVVHLEMSDFTVTPSSH